LLQYLGGGIAGGAESIAKVGFVGVGSVYVEITVCVCVCGKGVCQIPLP